MFRQFLEAYQTAIDFTEELDSPVSDAFVQTCLKDCKMFYDAYSQLWEDDEQAGHDFWMIRSGRCGFSSYTYGDNIAMHLDLQAKLLGEVCVYEDEETGEINQCTNL